VSTENQELAAGKEVLSYCGKCKLALAHVIVNMKSAKTIGKCECKTCKAQHNYRDPEAAKKKKAPRTPREPKKPAIPIEQQWKEALDQAAAPARPYSMKEKFVQGEVIEHSMFGKGVVTELVSDNKLKVLFQQETKLLICAR
jgi:hypothetical protein